jgi:hypothetical protein
MGALGPSYALEKRGHAHRKETQVRQASIEWNGQHPWGRRKKTQTLPPCKRAALVLSHNQSTALLR